MHFAMDRRGVLTAPRSRLDLEAFDSRFDVFPASADGVHRVAGGNGKLTLNVSRSLLRSVAAAEESFGALRRGEFHDRLGLDFSQKSVSKDSLTAKDRSGEV